MYKIVMTFLTNHTQYYFSTGTRIVCDVRYDICIKTMFCLYLPPVVCRRARVLFTLFVFVCLMVFNVTSNNISAISWWSVLLVEEIGRPAENHRPVASHRQTLS
jgi:hypothetical protein